MLVLGVVSLGLLSPLCSALLVPLEARNQVHKRDLKPAVLPDPWQFLECFSDSPAHRVLSRDGYFSTDGMSGLSCATYCLQKGYNIAGTEWGGECYCDTVLDPTAAWNTADKCGTPCSGDANEACGGYGTISIYSDAAPGPVTNQGVNGYTYSGCYSDSVDPRTLFGPFQVYDGADGMSVSECTAACNAQGYSVAGLEYGGECWCDNTILSSAERMDEAAGVDASGCNMLCKGNFSEYCGGSWKLSVYSKQRPKMTMNVFMKTATATMISMSSSMSIASSESMPSSSSSIVIPTVDTSATMSALDSIVFTSTTPSMSLAAPFVNATSSPNSPSISSPTSLSTSSPTSLSTSSTDTTSTSTTAALTTSTRVPVNVITGGNFENATLWSTWSSLPDPSSPNTGALKAVGPVQSTDTYNGSYSYQISEDPSILENSARTLCMQQNITFARAGQYAFTSYIGRISNPQAGSTTSSDQISYTVYIDDKHIFQGRVCNSSAGDCTVAAQSGKKMYNAVTGNYQAAAGSLGAHKFWLCATYSSTPRTGLQDVFLVDSVSLIGPSRAG